MLRLLSADIPNAEALTWQLQASVLGGAAVGFQDVCRELTIKYLTQVYKKPESWNMALGGLVLGSLILYLKGMRIMMF